MDDFWFDYMREGLRRAGVSKKKMNVRNPNGYRARHKGPR